ncbi:hypothetical protein [Brevundimonas lenta]|uniref:Secreted protein n=1 Tax=Brevundimonas lenta TaxID=424796 RepID=A0A7W6JFJ7_9CAUL|nr:hypothetical protein [Brevundimonas lenta]MBB4084171.1 hypothetical protein [Brevundimonas lenta]
MTFARALILACVVIAAPTAALAQATNPVPQYRPGFAVNSHRYQGDRQRYEMDRLRVQAAERQMFARQLEVETQLSIIDVQTRRQPALVDPASTRILRSPEEEGARRQSATERREATVSAVTGIDEWLDRPQP